MTVRSGTAQIGGKSQARKEQAEMRRATDTPPTPQPPRPGPQGPVKQQTPPAAQNNPNRGAEIAARLNTTTKAEAKAEEPKSEAKVDKPEGKPEAKLESKPEPKTDAKEEKPSKLSNTAKKAVRRAMFDEFRRVPIEQLKKSQDELSPYDANLIQEQCDLYLKYLCPEFYSQP